MSTYTSNNAEPDPNNEPDDDQRVYPAEDAYAPRRSTPAWRRIDPDLSGGYAEVYLALHAAEGFSPEEVTSS